MGLERNLGENGGIRVVLAQATLLESRNTLSGYLVKHKQSKYSASTSLFLTETAEIIWIF